MQGALLEGKWTLVTGSSRGIGRATAEAFAAEHASVIITSEEKEKENLDQACLQLTHCLAMCVACSDCSTGGVCMRACGGPLPVLDKGILYKPSGTGSLLCALQVAEVCRKNGAADVKVVIADLTDPKETQQLGEVRKLRLVIPMVLHPLWMRAVNLIPAGQVFSPLSSNAGEVRRGTVECQCHSRVQKRSGPGLLIGSTC